MAKPRKEQICVEKTPYDRLIARCVRRAYLCGEDKLTGKSFEHRRQWVEDRIRLLASIFTVDICSYTVMSNHYHICVKLCPEEIEQLSDDQILDRWTSIFNGPLIVQKWRAGESLQKAELETLGDTINVYRKRLSNLSWFMKCLNEPIARKANKEDNCTGHFWESRFKSDGLPTEEALLSCMAYIDLNPIRANMADTPETSDHTSIKERIKPSFDLTAAIEGQKDELALNHFNVPLKPLTAFEGNIFDGKQTGILFSFKDYLELVDYTGRIIREDKRGAIPDHIPPILERLSMDQQTWLDNTTGFKKNYQKHVKRRKKNLANSA